MDRLTLDFTLSSVVRVRLWQQDGRSQRHLEARVVVVFGEVERMKRECLGDHKRKAWKKFFLKDRRRRAHTTHNTHTHRDNSVEWELTRETFPDFCIGGVGFRRTTVTAR